MFIQLTKSINILKKPSLIAREISLKKKNFNFNFDIILVKDQNFKNLFCIIIKNF
jgi:hypothetical protein